jgi:prevent-host-death family protein
MARLELSKARKELPDIVSRTVARRRRTILSRQGRDVAALIPIEDLRLLERLEEEAMDREDLEDARAALAEPGENISLEDLKKELGL